jgi:hypothetical protein
MKQIITFHSKCIFLWNKDLPEDLDDPHQIELDHVGSNAEMEDDAHMTQIQMTVRTMSMQVTMMMIMMIMITMVMMMMNKLLVVDNGIHDHI